MKLKNCATIYNLLLKFKLLRLYQSLKMVKSGRVSMKEISVYLGHKSFNVTERVYEKYSPNFMKESANLVGDFIS